MRSSTAAMKNEMNSNNQHIGVEIEILDPAKVLLDSNLLCELANLTTKAFSYHNPQIAKAFAGSSKRDEFIKLSNDQLIDSIQQLAHANTVRKQDAILIVARDSSKQNKPTVGIISGVRNGHPHPSQEYMEKLFQSDCGLGAAIGHAFGSVLHHFDMMKMNEYQNVFMLGMVAVHPDYMRRGISVKLSDKLFAALQTNNYDGVFSIITSPNASGLLQRLISAYKAENVTLMDLEKSNDSSFFGVAFNEKGINTFKMFNTICRNQAPQADNTELVNIHEMKL